MPEPSGVDMTKRKKTETERRNSLDVTNADEKVKVRRQELFVRCIRILVVI